MHTYTPGIPTTDGTPLRAAGRTRGHRPEDAYARGRNNDNNHSDGDGGSDGGGSGVVQFEDWLSGVDQLTADEPEDDSDPATPSAMSLPQKRALMRVLRRRLERADR